MLPSNFFGQAVDNYINYVSSPTNTNGTIKDTSIIAAISGSSKQCTVYGRPKAVNGLYKAGFGDIYSG